MAVLKEVVVHYSVGLRANLGNFEHADCHAGRTETWDVSGMTSDEADNLYLLRRQHMKDVLDPIVEAEYNEVLGK